MSATPEGRRERLRERVDRWRERAQRSLPTLIGVGLILALLFLARAGSESYAGLAELAEREAELEIDLEETRLRVERLRRTVELLQDDPVVLERLAREELGLVRPGDTVVVLPQTDD
ncbi:MAG: septum formation initiator family protein [Acidobacteriota bacterium]|nr:septum formation initiator family protein [Acidobacteriota bacterium]MDE3266583.1 septum formation initiator family protein [Acidobacteriota bacterium]